MIFDRVDKDAKDFMVGLDTEFGHFGWRRGLSGKGSWVVEEVPNGGRRLERYRWRGKGGEEEEESQRFAYSVGRLQEIDGNLHEGIKEPSKSSFALSWASHIMHYACRQCCRPNMETFLEQEHYNEETEHQTSSRHTTISAGHQTTQILTA